MIERIVDSGLVPEPVLRAGIRAVCALRLREQKRRDPRAFVESLRASDVAIETAAANAQHYEVPAAFFERVLGPRLKYSSCYWPRGVTTLAAAENAMLELTAERAQLADGQRILDRGTLSHFATKRLEEIRALDDGRFHTSSIDRSSAALGGAIEVSGTGVSSLWVAK